jgi:hypothetical protein
MLCPQIGLGQNAVKPISSADVFSYFDKPYRADSRLINGDFYNTPKLSATSGHPFYFSPEWKTGELLLEGDLFKNLKLRYDIESGQLILNTVDYIESALQIILKKDRIEYFIMDGNLFQPFPESHPVTGLQFCQVLEEGHIDFILVKSKNLKITTTGLTDFAYSENKETYLRINREVIPFKGRRSLFKLYPSLKPELKEYIDKKRMSLRRMSLIEQTELISFCNNLIDRQE